AAKHLNLYIAGYPDTPGLTLAIENLANNSQFRLHIPASPGELWALREFDLPDGWEGQLVRVVARDQATGLRGWLAFSGPGPPTFWQKATISATVAGRVLMVSVVLLFPQFLLFLLARNRGFTSATQLIVAGLVTLSATIAIFYYSGFSDKFDPTVFGSAWVL